MLTPAERNSLLLSVSFLLLGGGIKVWKKWRVEIGPFDPATPSATAPDTAQTDATPFAAPVDSAAADTVAASDAAAVAAAAPVDATPARKPRPAKPKAPKEAPACPVDLNKASEGRIANLPGVGPRTAAAIAAYRTVHGPYREVRELLQVKGIGEKKLALIAPCLILSGAGAETLREQASVDPESVGEAGAAGP